MIYCKAECWAFEINRKFAERKFNCRRLNIFTKKNFTWTLYKNISGN